jgi:lycopene beta-cyclase
MNEISKHSNFEILYEKLEGVFSNETGTGIQLKEKSISGDYVFNSIIFKKPELISGEYWLLQHFKGWIIETDENAFDPATATIMDFRLSQKEGTAFCYLLPFSERKALVEFTVFSASKFTDEKYNQGLKDYINGTLGIKNYRIIEEETGSIPMTNHKFSSSQGGIIHMGTAGGQTKGSSGYTFQFIQKHCSSIVDALIHGKSPDVNGSSSRFHFYDSVLLNILHNNSLPGNEIFTDLFKKNTPSQVLRFLDNESSLADELKNISSLPTFPFLKAALLQMRARV